MLGAGRLASCKEHPTNDCEQARWLSAYHDGELPPQASADFERHLGQCSRCAAELARLRELTRLFGSAPAPELPQPALGRLHRSVDRWAFPGVVRMAEALAAVAAVVLIGCMVSLARQGTAPRSADTAPPWSVEAAVQQADSASADPEELWAMWMAQDLSRKDKHD